MGQEKIDAAEVFNWDYLVTIGAYMDKPEISTLDDAVRVFAYAFTSTANPEEQIRLLSEWLRDATYGQSRETAEEIHCRFSEAYSG